MKPQMQSDAPKHAHCCPCQQEHPASLLGQLSRRVFLGGMAAGGTVLAGLTWASLAQAAGDTDAPLAPPPRKPLKALPVFVYETPRRREGTSWRSWGGIETAEQAAAEVQRIGGELAALKAQADFPLEMLPIAQVRSRGDAARLDVSAADVLLVYAAGGWTDIYNTLAAMKKDCLFFVRHQSGPVYLWYEIISPRFLRQHSDELAVDGMHFDDVVVDDPAEMLWRMRALAGLKNTRGSRIVAVGGPSGWSCPSAPGLAKERFGLDIQTVKYDELAKLLQEAQADDATVARARRRADAYLASPDTKLETKREFVERCFVLEEMFRRLMQRAECRALTINACMGTIMNVAKTTACLPLSTLNDDGYLAFCESDFVVVPSGLLLANISGLPVFLNDPTYPHHGVITLAHCASPRKMDGKTPEPTSLMTHFESDWGAAPKVDMRIGQKVTNIAPDFKAERWMGLLGEITAHPLLPICRTQIDVKFEVDSSLVAERMPGFHWMTCYGDYSRELGYALRRVGIKWDFLG